MDISVIIPVYNSASTITESMDSVISELITNPYEWELILVNDGSKDNSQQIIEKYLEQSKYAPHIQLINQRNGGAAVARNTGIEASSGKFIAFNDSDDRWLPGKIELQMTYLIANPDVDMVGGAHEVNKFSSPFKKLDDITEISLKDNIKKNYFGPPMVIIHRYLMDEKGLMFDSTMRTGGEEGSLFYPLIHFGKCVLINQKVSESISGKNQWGETGLTAHVVKMEKGVIHNKVMAYKNGYISLPAFINSYLLSIVKVSRRLLIKRVRQIKSKIK